MPSGAWAVVRGSRIWWVLWWLGVPGARGRWLASVSRVSRLWDDPGLARLQMSVLERGRRVWWRYEVLHYPLRGLS